MPLTGPRDRPGSAMARLARWIGEPRLAVMPASAASGAAGKAAGAA